MSRATWELLESNLSGAEPSRPGLRGGKDVLEMRKSWPVLVTLAAVISATPGAAVADFGVEGSVAPTMSSVDHTTQVFADTITRATGPLAGTAAIEDEASIVGAYGGSSVARYVADLSHAAIGSYAAFDATHNFSYVGPGDIELWKRDSGQAQASARAWDTLRVTLPAGDYGDGVFAVLHGRVTGDVSVVGDFFAEGQAGWGVEVLAPGVSVPLVSGDTGIVHASSDPWPVIGNQLVPVFSPVRFDIPLASGVLATPKQVDIRVSMYLQDLAAVNSTKGAGSALSDLGGTLYFTSFTIPEGASWTSDSGVFLDEPLLEPGRWSLLLVGAAVLALVRTTRVLAAMT